jgi:alkanesulfonate monooxygenase SsuD/methylene tetrahydromethanopterin reductase-like flavin-dependent oxidoreductase (luciferase family)
MLRIAGELADGTVTAFTGPKAVETHIVPRINGAARSGWPAGRGCVGVGVAVTDDAAAAGAAARDFRYGTLPAYRRMLDIEVPQAQQTSPLLATKPRSSGRCVGWPPRAPPTCSL